MRFSWITGTAGRMHVEAVLALGTATDEAWQLWKETPKGRKLDVAYAPVTHPTQPESASKGDQGKLADATKKLLKNWNGALATLAPAIANPDVPTPLAPYGDSWMEGDRPPVPEFDFPAGLPAWMHEQDGWAKRVGSSDLAKRRNITITVPKGILS